MKMLFFNLLLLFMYAEKRDLFIFYNQDGVAIKDRQLAELNKDKTGLQERDIVIHTLKTDSAKAQAKKYNVNANTAFTVILVGKDGGEKLRLDSVLTTAKLFSTIDAMPMRKSEMKNK
jgi:hypothetical protein